MTRRETALTAALLLLLAAAPLVVSNVVLNVLTSALIVALAAQGWNLLGGYAGQLSFGHALFFGAGAYTTAVLQVRFGQGAWLGLLAGVAAGAAAGAIVGALAFRARLRGSYFALVTLAFAEVARILVNATDLTGGAAGLLIRLQPGLSNLQFASRSAFVWLLTVAVGLVVLLTAMLTRGRFGARLVALRENEDAARALGVDVLRSKIAAMVLSAGITALAGCLYAQNFLYLDAGIGFGTWISVEVLIACIIGGGGTVLGPLVGALVLHGAGQGLSWAVNGLAGSVPGLDLAFFGLLLILAVAFLPAGLVGRRRSGRTT